MLYDSLDNDGGLSGPFSKPYGWGFDADYV